MNTSSKILLPLIVLLVLIGVIAWKMTGTSFRSSEDTKLSQDITKIKAQNQLVEPTGDVDATVNAFLSYTNDTDILNDTSDADTLSLEEQEVVNTYTENYDK